MTAYIKQYDITFRPLHQGSRLLNELKRRLKILSRNQTSISIESRGLICAIFVDVWRQERISGKRIQKPGHSVIEEGHLAGM